MVMAYRLMLMLTGYLLMHSANANANGQQATSQCLMLLHRSQANGPQVNKQPAYGFFNSGPTTVPLSPPTCGEGKGLN
jgi:hypothetical protein